MPLNFMSLFDQIEAALKAWRATTPDAVKQPHQLLLDDERYDDLLEQARENGMSSPSNPQYEEDRLEFRGVRVYRAKAEGIRYV